MNMFKTERDKQEEKEFNDSFSRPSASLNAKLAPHYLFGESLLPAAGQRRVYPNMDGQV